MRLFVIAILLTCAAPGSGQGGMSMLGVDATVPPAPAAEAPPAKTYHVSSEAQLDRILARPGYWKKYISGAESLTGAEARFHGRKAEVESWGSWARDWAFGTISTLASPGDIAPWTFRNVALNDYYRAYNEYLRSMHEYGYLAPATYTKRKAWVDKKLY